MDYIDPLKVMRNPQTLAAYRDYQRQVRAAGQPWLTIALILTLAEIALIAFALWRNDLHDRVLLSAYLALLFVSGLCFAVATFRMWRFRRTHRLELP